MRYTGRSAGAQPVPVSQVIEDGRGPVKVYTDDMDAAARQHLSQLPVVHAGIGAHLLAVSK